MSIEIPVYATGIRDGELITSNPKSSQNRGTIIRVKGIYPPSKSGIQKYSKQDLVERLNNIDFFTNLTPDQRYDYLLDQAVNNDDLYLNDVPLKIKFLKISGPGFLTKLTEAQINEILAGNPDDPEGYWDIQQIYQMIPRKPGSKAYRHTLIFRPNIWTLMYEFKQTNSYLGPVIDLETQTLKTQAIATPNQTIYVFDITSNLIMSKDFGILTALTTENTLTVKNLYNLLTKVISISETEFTELYELMNWYTPALHKSLIQKIIRTGARSIEYNSELYPAEQVLLISFISLLLNPGSFVPDIQRYVSGLESALKRLAVSICEDSYLENYQHILILYAGAMLAQNIKTWKPNNEYILQAFKTGLSSLQDKRSYMYRTRGEISKVTTLDEYSMSYLLLAELRSFQTDITMLGAIWEHQGEVNEYIPDHLMPVMPLVHAVDHHVYTEIVYYYLDVNIPYTELVHYLWEYSSGVNPRKIKYQGYFDNMESEPFIQQTRTGQTLLYFAKASVEPKFNIVQTRELLETQIPVEYRLDESWIAGLIGPIEVKLKSGTAIVTIRADDIYEMIAIKKPARGAKTMPELTEEERSHAIKRVKNKLEQGILISDVPETLPIFKDAMIILRSDEYFILRENNAYSLTDILNTKTTFPEHEPLQLSVLNSIIYRGSGIQAGANQQLEELLNSLDKQVLSRFIVHLSGYKSDISLYKISRDGTGQEYTVLPEDTQVFKLLSDLTVLYPAAIQRDPWTPSKKFKINYGPLLWLIREYISKLIQSSSSENIWPQISDRLNRKLWEHQRDSVEKMVNRTLTNKRGHLIWLPVGLGKTLIVLTYVKWLIENSKMPKYCVYTLPASAMDSIIGEIKAFNLPHQVMDMRANGKNQKIKMGMINLIKHDHMRMNTFPGQIKEIASDLLFIVDEFHKTLNKTIRTSIALEVSRLSHDFIGLSGTIINTGNVSDLILWLEQIVEFEVTEKNFWVAVSAMISKKVHTQVIVNRHEVLATFTESQADKYYDLVSPALGGTNVRSGVQDFQKAVEICYQACYDYMIKLTIGYIQAGDRVMLVAKDIKTQNLFEQQLIDLGLGTNLIFKITSDQPINYLPDDPRNYWVIITTIRQSEGYNLTGMRVMINSVYFSNQATREQLEGRINRIGQPAKEIEIVTVHIGLLTNVLEKYNSARNLSEALKGFAEEVNLTRAELQAIL